MKVNGKITARKLIPSIEQFLELTSKKIISLEENWDHAKGTPVFTIKGQYSTRGWTEWTQGFQYGCAILQYDMTRERKFLDIGRKKTIKQHSAQQKLSYFRARGPNNEKERTQKR